MTPGPAPRGGTKRKSTEAQTPVLQQPHIIPEIPGGIFNFFFQLRGISQSFIYLFWFHKSGVAVGSCKKWSILYFP